MMSKALRGLVLSSILFLVSASTGALLAVVTHLPARFGGLLSGNDVVLDFLLLNGTALSPDLALLLAQLVLTACALGRGRAARFGVIGLTLLGAAYTLGQLGEPITLHSLMPATFNLAPAAVAVINIVCSSAMVVFGVRAWRSREQAHQSGVAPQTPHHMHIARQDTAQVGDAHDHRS